MAAPKGHPKWGGRAKGTPNKNYLDVQEWAKLIWDGADKANLNGKELIELGFRGLGLLLPKVPGIPGSPSESVRNVDELLEAYEKEKANLVKESKNADPQ
jgi:hypothetical protein